ncbi:hypothetical protein ABIB81_007673 [Bradyrhizobium sp. I1.7.5]
MLTLAPPKMPESNLAAHWLLDHLVDDQSKPRSSTHRKTVAHRRSGSAPGMRCRSRPDAPGRRGRLPALTGQAIGQIAAELRNRADVGSLDRCVAGDRLRTIMSSIMRWRRVLKSGISIRPSEGDGLQHPHPLSPEAIHATLPVITPRQRLRSIPNRFKLGQRFLGSNHIRRRRRVCRTRYGRRDGD